MTNLKNHKLLSEFVRKEPTEMGAISIKESVQLLDSISKVAKKLGYDCYVKGYPKKILDYEPTNEEYHLKTLEDIAELSPEQFEMFIEDLRNWCNITRHVKELKNIGVKIEKKEGMVWQDTGKHEAKIKIQADLSNKL